jgi:hypothetical protein
MLGVVDVERPSSSSGKASGLDAGDEDFSSAPMATIRMKLGIKGGRS